MANKKIGCGGFLIDNETIKEENGVLKASSSSSGGIFHASFSLDGNDNPICDKTYAEIKAAHDAGKLIVLDDSIFFSSVIMYYDNFDQSFSAMTFSNEADGLGVASWYMNPDDLVRNTALCSYTT